VLLAPVACCTHTHRREWRVLRFLQILTRENSGAVALLHRQRTQTQNNNSTCTQCTRSWPPPTLSPS
jgi:hypothetical protein